MAALDADYQVARRTVRALNAHIRAAQARGEDGAVVEALAHRRDAALSQALAVRDVVSGIHEDRLATRSEHLAAHAEKVTDPEPQVPSIPEGFSPAGFDGIGRHYLTGTFRDPHGYDVNGRDVRGADRAGWLESGRHADTGTRFDVEGYGADGFHRRHGFDRLGFHKATGTQYDVADRTLADVERADAARGLGAPQQAEAAPTPAETSESPAAPAVLPFRSKRDVATAIRTVGSRWSIEQGGTSTPVTVVRSSTTSIWVSPDAADAGEKPIWLPIGDQSSWTVHNDGFDEAGVTRVRRLAAA